MQTLNQFNMKKITLVAFFILLNSSLFGQTPNFYFSISDPRIKDEKGEHIWFYPLESVRSVEDKKVLEKRIANKMNSIQKTSYTKKGEKYLTITHTFNQLGRIVSTHYLQHKNNKTWSDKINYYNDSLINQVISKKYNGDTIVYNYSFEIIDGKLYYKGYETSKNQKIVRSKLITRNKAGKPTSKLQLYDRNLKHSSETKSYYSEDNQLIKTEYYHDNKLESVYNYDCNAEGKKIENKKVESSDICKWTEERRDGSYINYSRSTNEKKNYLSVSFYDKDSAFVYWKKYLNDSILVESRNYYNDTKIDVYRRFKDKQKIIWSSKSIYDDNHNLLEHEFINYGRKNTYISTKINTYNSEGLLASKTTYENHKKPYKTSYTYNSKGLIVSAIKKHGIKRQTKYKYTYAYTFFE